MVGRYDSDCVEWVKVAVYGRQVCDCCIGNPVSLWAVVFCSGVGFL